MPTFDEVHLEITTSDRPEPTLEPLTATITVRTRISLDPTDDGDREGYVGQFQILGGSRLDDLEPLFFLSWGGKVSIDFRGSRLEVPLLFDRFAVKLETRQPISRSGRVLRSDLNLNPGVTEIRFSEPVPEGFNPAAIPTPEPSFPWEWARAPMPIKVLAQEMFAARVVLTQPPRKPVSLSELSNTVVRAF